MLQKWFSENAQRVFRLPTFHGRPLVKIAMVSFLSRKPALSLDARNRSSCPKADLYVVATIVWKRPFEAALGWSVRGVGQIAKLIFQ